MKIRYKLIIGFIIIILPLSIFFYFLITYIQQTNLRATLLDKTQDQEQTFYDFKEGDTKTLSSLVETIAQNQNIKDIYIEKDRDKLFDYINPLFQNLKTQYHVTHFYFISPDGYVFLRAHKKETYGDKVERSSFKKANETKKTSSEIELGKTAYALRVVTPYYNNNGELIGYLELGEEIDHFFEILKEKSGSNFSLMVDKKYIDKNEWANLRKTSGLKNNWDDLKKYLVINKTTNDPSDESCFNESNTEKIEGGEKVLGQEKKENKIFSCGGFPIKNNAGQYTGAVLISADITDQIYAVKKINTVILLVLITIFILALLINLFIAYSFAKPIETLHHGTEKVEQGNLDFKVGIKTKDEIGQLSRSFEKMTVTLKKSREKIQNQIKELQKSEEKFRNLFESSQDAIMTLAPPDWKFTSGNPATVKMFGAKDEKEFISYEPWKLSPENQPDRRPSGEKAKEMIEKAMKEGSNLFEWTHKRINGEDFPATVLLSRIEQDGNVFLQATVRDITEIKKAEEELKRFNKLAIDRELKMIELKQKIKDLEGKNV